MSSSTIGAGKLNGVCVPEVRSFDGADSTSSRMRTMARLLKYLNDG